MTEKGFGRRDFLKGAVVGGAAAATATPAIVPQEAQAQQPAAPPPATYAFLNLEEAAFIEAVTLRSTAARPNATRAFIKRGAFFAVLTMRARVDAPARGDPVAARTSSPGVRPTLSRTMRWWIHRRTGLKSPTRNDSSSVGSSRCSAA